MREGTGVAAPPGISLPSAPLGEATFPEAGMRGGAAEVAVPISPPSPGLLDGDAGETLLAPLPLPRGAPSPSVPKAAAATATAPITNSPETRTPSETAIPPPPDVVAPTTATTTGVPHIIGPHGVRGKARHRIVHLRR